MKDVKIRNSNYELMRIISMFLIVLYHAIVHGHAIENSANESVKLLLQLIVFITIMHVNSFILVSGYYQCEKKFNFSKVCKLITSSLFYRILIIVLFTTLGIVNLSKVYIFRETFILNIDEYWFIKVYLFLYLLSPFINILIKKIEKGDYQKLLLVLFMSVSFIPYVTGNKAFENNGYTLCNFIFLYFLGAYLKKYPVNESYFFKIFSKKFLQLFYIVIFFISIFTNYILYIAANYISGINSITYELADNVMFMSLAYSNPFVLLQSLSYFLFFGTLSINNKIINKISSLTMGIYMIHDNSFIRRVIYKLLKIDRLNITSYKFILYLIVVSIFIFIFAAIIEFIRQLIFNFINKRKISFKMKNNIANWYKEVKKIQIYD